MERKLEQFLLVYKSNKKQAKIVRALKRGENGNFFRNRSHLIKKNKYGENDYRIFEIPL